jgi:hypothetical protein
MSDTISGAHVTASYAFEDPKAHRLKPEEHLASDEDFVAFGRGVDISVSRNQNKERVYGIGDRNAQASPLKDFAGSATVNGILSSPYWFLGILGAVTDGGVAEAYTHTYTETNCLPTMTIHRTMDFGATEGTEILYGAVINNASISAAVNESVKFSLEMPFRFCEVDKATAIDEIVDTEEIFTFAGGKITTPSGDLALVQNFEMTWNNNAEQEKGIGSRYFEAVSANNREYNFNYTIAITNYDVLEEFLAGSELASLILEFTNCAGDKIVATFSDVHINEDSLATSITEVVKEDVTGWAHNCTSVVYTNDVENAPAEADNIV